MISCRRKAAPKISREESSRWRFHQRISPILFHPFSFFFSLSLFFSLPIQRRTPPIQLETLHLLNLSRSDSYLQYRHSGEVRRGEAAAAETWRFRGSCKIDSRSRMGLREAERIFKVISSLSAGLHVARERSFGYPFVTLDSVAMIPRLIRFDQVFLKYA